MLDEFDVELTLDEELVKFDLVLLAEVFDDELVVLLTDVVFDFVLLIVVLLDYDEFEVVFVFVVALVEVVLVLPVTYKLP